MERIGNLMQSQQLNVSVSLKGVSGKPVSDATALTLLQLMEQTQNRYKNECLPPGTPDMYLSEWERLVTRHGLERFMVALSKAIDDNKFFPEPFDIRQHCEQLASGARDAQKAKDHIGELAEWERTWLRERLEDERDGKLGTPLTPEQRRKADALGLQLRQER